MATPVKRKRGPYFKDLVSPDQNNAHKPRTTAWRAKRKLAEANAKHHRPMPYDDVSASGTSADTDVPQTSQLSDPDSSPELDHTTDELTADIQTDEQNGLIEEMEDLSNGQPVFADDEVDLSSDEEADERDEDGDFQNIPDEPLYNGSRISLAVSIFLILTFATRHALSGEALKDLLTLIEIHCLTPNLCGNSVKYLHDFFLKMKSPIQLHYYCNICLIYLGVEKSAQCADCGKDDMSYFLVMPAIEQLKKLFRCSEMTELLKYRENRKKEQPGNLEDVLDGELYKEIFSGEFFRGMQPDRSSEIHISCQLNTDCVSLFRSSSFSIWPQYIVVNELPPKNRYSRKFRMFCGLWFGKTKAIMNIFLNPLVREFKELYNQGCTVVVGGKTKLVHAVLMSVVCDAPARCLMQNFTQFNGFFSCPTCLSKGSSVKTSERGSTLTYPLMPDPNNVRNGHAKERTHFDTLEHARAAELSATTTSGVKGFSPLFSLPKFNVIRGVTVDYMHCVLLGVVKMLLNQWFHKSHRQSNFYLGNSMDVLNRRILSITPPRTISRSPKGFNDLSQWKASEFRSFLLFYSLPCLWGILPAVYLDHYLLLVQAVHILLSSSIALDEIQKAKLMLIRFCGGIEEHDESRYATSNVHALLHLCQKVTDLGPLFCHSCFFYEDLNKDLRNFFHGTQKIEFQILTAITIQQQIPNMRTLLSPGSATERLYKMMTQRYSTSNQLPLSSGIFAVGHLRPCSIPERLLAEIESLYGRLISSSQFFRLLIDGQMYHSKGYRCASKRNSYTVQYYCGDTIQLGQIQYFLKCVLANKVVTLAIMKRLKVDHEFRDIKLPSHFYPISEAGDIPMKPVSVVKMKSLCVWLAINGLSKCFVGIFPNNTEGD